MSDANKDKNLQENDEHERKMSDVNEFETIPGSEDHEHCETPSNHIQTTPHSNCDKLKIDFVERISKGDHIQASEERGPCEASSDHIQIEPNIYIIERFADLISNLRMSNDNELATIHESEEHVHCEDRSDCMEIEPMCHEPKTDVIDELETIRESEGDEHREAPIDDIRLEPMGHKPKIEVSEISLTNSDTFDMSFVLVEACGDEQVGNVAVSDDVSVDQAVGDSTKENEVNDKSKKEEINDENKKEEIKKNSQSEGVTNQINLDQWYKYKQILEEYLTKMKVSEHDMKTKSYDELCKMLLPPMTLYRERNRFYTTKRDFDESLADYWKRLKDLSETCQFGKRLDQVVTDKFVTSLSDSIFYALCTDCQTETDSKTALEIATKNDDGTVHYSSRSSDLDYLSLSFMRGSRMNAINKKVDSYLAEIIRNEIMEKGLCVEWDEIAGLDFPKSVIKESIVWPLRRPDIFNGLRKLPKGMLLFGPPGNGKTMIGKCIASQSKSTFFYVSAASLTSKWYGEGEKLVRALFAVAAEHQPSVIFFDEVDSLLTGRNKNDHEASRRMKTEFMIQLDGAATKDNDRVLLIGATNRPQDLDEAIRRRFVKRLYIPLPDVTARKQLLNILLKNENSNLSDSDINEIATSTNGYSGADIKWLCQDAAMEPLRSVSADRMTDVELKDIRPLELSDFVMSLQRVRPSVSSNDLTAMIEWDQLYGSNSDRPDYHGKQVMYS